jgi:CDP-diacylglycerol pyrophosphatase
MRDYFSLNLRYLRLGAAAAVLLAIMAIVSAIGAAVLKPGEITQSKNEHSRKLAADECRLDQHARTAYCNVQGRKVRVIRF